MLAEDPAEAEKLARKSLRDLDEDQWSAAAREMECLPAGWEGDEIPYGPGISDDPDRTVDEWIKQGAAPRYTQLLNRLSTGRMR